MKTVFAPTVAGKLVNRLTDRMLSFRYLVERKQLLLFFLSIYCVLCYIAYKRLWEGTQRRTFNIGLPTSLWFNNTLFSTSGMFSASDINKPCYESTKAKPLIAVGSGITSRKLSNVSEKNIGEKFQFFRTFLPTFCHTASPPFVYKFYLAYDRIDQVFINERLRDAFQREFHAAVASGSCRDRCIIANLSMVECHYAGKPTWAQNDAMLEAYLDDVDYFYRVNDDTRMLTGGWTEKFISTLENYDPPRVGVVGPKHTGGNVGILTYDFVHRTHVDIFGFYYPHVFTDWWGDTWITRVYKPNRSTKLQEVHLAHTLGLGQRYVVRYEVQRHLGIQLAHDIAVINR